MNWPKRCTICGISQRELMEICFLPICPSFQQRQSTQQRRQQKSIDLPPIQFYQPEERDDQ